MNELCENDDQSTGSVTSASDARLLARFVQTCDEPAFRALVERHSRLVFGVCSRVLHNRHDAEEAFQAAFMVLAQKADRLECDHSLAPWLYGVAYRVAVRSAQKKTRRRESSLTMDVLANDDVLESLADSHWRQVLDDELNRLPKKYRQPLVLHYLLGKNNAEIAAELGLTVRTVEGRQRRGKAKLRQRLALRKVSLPLAVATLAAASQAAEAAPLEALIETTVKESLSYAAGKDVAVCSEGALSLARPEVLAMKFSVAHAAVFTLFIVVAGAAFGLAKNEATSGGEGALQLAADADVADPFAAEPKNDVVVQLTVAKEDVEPAKDNRQVTSATSTADYPPRTLSRQEKRIYEALSEPLTAPLDYAELPLNQIALALAEDYGIQIVFDVVALDALAISPETEVTIQLRDVRLKSALALILGQIEDLTYIVKHDVLLITSEDVVQKNLQPRIYNIRSLGIPIDDLIDALTTTVDHDSWQENGTGEGAIAILGNEMLSISQTQTVHAEIAAFLTELQAQVADK